MDSNQRRHFESYLRGNVYMTASAADFPPTSKGGQSMLRLQDFIAEIRHLDALRVSGDNAQKQATIAKRDDRKSLRAQISAMSRTSDTIALDHPEFKGKFLWSGERVSDQTLLAIARAFAEEGVPASARFIEYGLPADFLQKLNVTIGSLEQHIIEQNAGTAARIAARTGLAEKFELADLEMERMDTAVRNTYHDNPAKLAAWDRARRIERAPHSSNGGEEDQEDDATLPAQVDSEG